MLWRRSSCTARSRSNFSLVRFRRSLSTSPSSSTFRVLSDAISRPWLWLKVLKIFTWKKVLSNIWNGFCNFIELKKKNDRYICITNFNVQLPVIFCYNLEKQILILVHEKTEPSYKPLNSSSSRYLIFLLMLNILLTGFLFSLGKNSTFWFQNRYHTFILYDFFW